MTKFDFTTKEEYLTYRAEWKAEYKALSAIIRDTKSQRKQFIWEYYKGADKSIRNKTKIGENPNYNNSASDMVFNLKERARILLEELINAKIESGKQREKNGQDDRNAA